MAIIECRDLSFRYANGLNSQCQIPELCIEPGECVVLCGRSGSGKSTFLRLLNGLIPDFYEGELLGTCVCAGYISGKHSVEEFSTVVGSVFQNPATQFFHRIVEDELVFPCENQGVPRQEIARRLKQTTHLFEIERLLMRDLLSASGGERQRIAIATSMMQQPQVVVLDEPTANLDLQGIEQVKYHIQSLIEQGITVIIAEHRMNFLKEVATRYLYFDEGVLKYDWSPVEYLSLSNEVRYALGLRKVEIDYTLPLIAQPSKGLSLHSVVLGDKDYPLAYLSCIQFPVNQVIGIVGPNGSGKTTMAKYIAGLSNYPGEVKWNNQELPSEERLRQVAFVMQEVRLQLHAHTVRHEILLGAQDLSRFEEIVECLNLTELLNRHPMTLSGGEQQRVMIANALLSDKKIFIFDEPTSGLDYDQMRRVATLLQQLKQPDRVVLVITHDEELLEAACDTVYHMEEKKTTI